MTVRLIFFGLLTVVLSACGGGTRAPAAPSYTSGSLIPPAARSSKQGLKSYVVKGVRYYPRDDRGYRQRGLASWYGPKFHGKLTANGERYNQWALTAAHKTLPLGSYVKVTNLDNGRSLVLLINDRGPFVRGRIIDLSRRAADILGVIKKGTAPVLVERTNRSGYPLVRRAAAPPPRQYNTPTYQQAPAQTVSRQPSARMPSSADPVLVQVGSFADFYNARRLQQDLVAFGPTSITQVFAASGQIVYRVQVGPFSDLMRAERVLADIHAKGHTSAALFDLKALQTNSR
ncbi:MAG: septal ring lytic transglycosylase RlpA family protein [Pseudomonadota bacterium]